MRVCVWERESAYYRQWWKEEMRNWGAGDEEKTKHRENNLIVELDGCSSSFLFFICFLFPLLIFLPSEPLSISPNSLMAPISAHTCACAHMHFRCFHMWFIRSEQQLVLMCRGAADDWLFPDTGRGLMLMMAALLLPLITQSNREVSKTKRTSWTTALEKAAE